MNELWERIVPFIAGYPYAIIPVRHRHSLAVVKEIFDYFEESLDIAILIA
jgi:hypothetical protein